MHGTAQQVVECSAIDDFGFGVPVPGGEGVLEAAAEAFALFGRDEKASDPPVEIAQGGQDRMNPV
jgi:hypothetical protein